MNTGWSIEHPTVFVEGERDRITARSGKIEYDIEFTNLKSGLTQFISQFGNLYYGKFSPAHFTNIFNYNRREFLKHLTNALNLTDWNEHALFSSAFYMFMCRICQKESWVWPALCSRLADSSIKQTSGISRLVATGICKNNPWDHYNVLFLESKNNNIADTLTDFVSVDTDKKLHQILNLEFANDFFQVSQTKIGLTVDCNNNLIFDYINNHTFHDIVTAETQQLWADLCSWHLQYGPKPKLKIYTNWPALVTNQFDFWDIEIAGDVNGVKRNISLPAHLENQIRWRHDFFPFESNQHVLFIVEPRPIDVTELLCWVNLKNTTFISSDWSFLLYRTDKQYSNTFVDLSYIPSNK